MEIMLTRTDSPFIIKNTKPVMFFYKLPEKIRKDYEATFKTFVRFDDRKWVSHHIEKVGQYFKNISPEKFIYLRDHLPDYDYFIFYEMFIILHPVIKFIVEEYGLYERYPECLI